MEHESDDGFLTGRLLVAMPGMNDPRFEHAVIFLCVHTAQGAMGLVVNRPADAMNFEVLLDQLKIETTRHFPRGGVYFGGPVDLSRGFVLHSSDYCDEGATMQVNEGFGMTASLDVLRAIAVGDGPRESMLALGYAGWGPGQLEQEIRANGWLIAKADSDIVFGHDDARKWQLALNSLGVDPRLLAGTGGRA